MKKLIMMMAFLTPFVSKAQTDTTGTLTKLGDRAPSFTFSIDRNKTANLTDYKGKVVVIDFWATWCPPCRMELPRIQKEIWDKYKDNPKFALIAVDRGENWNKTLPFEKDNKYTFLMTPDPDKKIYSLYAKQYIPRIVVIGEDGLIIYQSMGYDEKDFSNLLTLLANKL